MHYLEVEEAINAPGLRLVLSAGVPGPWGEAAKSILAHKNLDYTPVLQQGGGKNEALQTWTGQTAAPVAVLDGFAPVCHWFDLLMMAERLSPEKPLVPDDCADRIDVLGISALSRRRRGLSDGVGACKCLLRCCCCPSRPDIAVRLGAKYGWTAEALALTVATGRLESISAELDGRLLRQEAAGSGFMVGSTSVTAADFYWANFAGMIKPLGPEDNPMPDYMRTTVRVCR